MNAMVIPESGKAYQLMNVITTAYSEGNIVIMWMDSEGNLKTSTYTPSSLNGGRIVFG